MGAEVEWDRKMGRIRVAASSLSGVEVGVADTPDLLPTVAVLGAAADGTTRVSDDAAARIRPASRSHSTSAPIRSSIPTMAESPCALG